MLTWWGTKLEPPVATDVQYAINNTGGVRSWIILVYVSEFAFLVDIVALIFTPEYQVKEEIPKCKTHTTN